MTRLSDFTSAPKPAPDLYGARLVGWQNDRGDITVNPDVAAHWTTSGAFKSVKRVYVQSA